MRRHLVLSAAAVLLAAGSIVGAPTAGATNPGPSQIYQAPGFESCAAPSSNTMNTWWTNSPYFFTGIYASGGSRGCSQPNLTLSWAQNAAGSGWGFAPLSVDLQPPCSTFANRFSSNSTTAFSQGQSTGAAMVTALNNLGFPTGTVGYYDLESDGNGTCDTAILGYIHGFVSQMANSSDFGGLYSFCASNWSTWGSASSAVPYAIWVADLGTSGHSLIGTNCVSSTMWTNNQRTRQWLQSTSRSYGGIGLVVDDDCAYTGRIDAGSSLTGVTC